MTVPIPSHGTDFVVVANRLPVDRDIDENGESIWRTSPGGLVTALEPVMKAKGGAWVGWHGAPDETVQPFEHEGYQVEPVRLTAQEVTDYYEGFSNATLWPLYHDAVAFPEFDRDWWESYVTVNERFAAITAQVAAEGATVWVQDYQLQLVPQLLRRFRPDLTIGFFLHIPFPPIELFMQLPWRKAIVEGLLGADLVGFQVAGAAQNFIRLSHKLLGAKTGKDTVRAEDGRIVRARAYPISIDTASFKEMAEQPEVAEAAERLRSDLGNPKKLFLGVDRLDYTKGLRQRVKAFGELFDSGDLDPEECVFVQVATPSRERVDEYRKLRDDIDLMIGRINSHAGRMGNPVVEYRNASYPRAELAAMYRAADVMVVTPLRDGMNLVAKEYLACHGSDDGALVLSEFAGAAEELKQAYLVNPYDTDGMKEQIVRAATDDLATRRKRMRALRRQVATHTIERWAEKILNDLEEARHGDS